MSDVLIRDFRKSDLDDLLVLLPLANAEEFRVTGFDPDHVRDLVNRLYGWKARFLIGLLRLFGKEPVKFLVAEVAGRFVGTTVIEDRGKAGGISVVMVHPDFRRRGIATKLMTTAIDYCRSRRKVRAVLGVLSNNVVAKDLYLKLGFKSFESSIYFVGESDLINVVKQNGNVEVRSFERGDVDEVFDLAVASVDPIRLKIYDLSKRGLVTPFLRRLFVSSNQLQLVAIHDDKIVGYAEASYTTPNETAKISLVYVSSEAIGLGVDKALVTEAGREIEEASVKRLRVVVPSSNQALIDAVKTLGFKEALTVDSMVLEFS